MIVTSNLNGLNSDNLLFEITECDPENSEGFFKWSTRGFGIK